MLSLAFVAGPTLAMACGFALILTDSQWTHAWGSLTFLGIFGECCILDLSPLDPQRLGSIEPAEHNGAGFAVQESGVLWPACLAW